MRRLLARLPERERRVVTMTYGPDGQGERTLKEIGAVLGVSDARVRQLREQALSRLRRMAEG